MGHRAVLVKRAVVQSGTGRSLMRRGEDRRGIERASTSVLSAGSAGKHRCKMVLCCAVRCGVGLSRGQKSSHPERCGRQEEEEEEEDWLRREARLSHVRDFYVRGRRGGARKSNAGGSSSSSSLSSSSSSSALHCTLRLREGSSDYPSACLCQAGSHRARSQS